MAYINVLSVFGNWWSVKPFMEQFFWVIAILATVLFAVQSVMSLVGHDDSDAGGDADADVMDDHGIGYQFITLKNLAAFFTLFGWTGLAVYSSGQGKTMALVCALLAGLAAMFLMAWLFKQMNKLQYNGTVDLQNAVGLSAKVYLTIPASRNGSGKIHVTIQSSMRELEALTDDQSDIATGSMVKIQSVISENIMLVTKLV